MTIGILGAGSFGTAVANLAAMNVDVLVYSRKPELVQRINETHEHLGVVLSDRIKATNSLQEIAETCTLIFPIVPSANFRSVIRQISPFLRPYHILIHGTKGLDLVGFEEENLKNAQLTRANVKTMSEVILEETNVVRVGCLSGPNLAAEIMQGQPAAAVIGSRFKEVVEIGKKALNSKKFHVFGTPEITGAELAGALKNVIALGSGILGGLGLGKNLQSMLITRGLTEMINIATKLGATNRAFVGTAGIGDLVATATSTNSRNYTFGMRLAQGETPEQILATMTEVAEGVRTLKIAYRLARSYKIHVPIITILHSIVFDGYDIQKAITYLMEYPYDVDVDFL